VLHIQNSIEKRPFVEFSSPELPRIKTEHTQISNQNILPSAVLPSAVETFLVSSSSEFYAVPDIFEVFEQFLENDTISVTVQTPSLPTEKLVIPSETTTEKTLHLENSDLTVSSENLSSPTTGSITSDEELVYHQNVNLTVIADEIVLSTERPSSTDSATDTHSTELFLEEVDKTQPVTPKANEVVEVTTELDSHQEINKFTSIDTTTENPMQTFQTSIQTPKAKRKKTKKKKKKTKKKKGSFGNYKVQILQSFGLENHQGDAKQYDLIDFDEINQKQSTSPPNLKKTAQLPVLKIAPANISSELDCYYLRSKIKSRSHFYRDEKNCTKCVCKVKYIPKFIKIKINQR